MARRDLKPEVSDRSTSPQEAPATGSPPSPSCNPLAWVDRHGDALYRYAFLMLRNQAEAEDAVQETLLAALQAASSFRAEASERTWLIGILRHKAIDQIRKLHREAPLGEIEPDEAVDGLFDRSGFWKKKPAHWASDPSSLAESGEFWNVFEDCLKSLPERAARAFSLRVLDGSDSEDVCKVLNITANNMCVLLHRARTRLRECLEANWFLSQPEDGR